MFDRKKYKLDAKSALKKRRSVPAFAILFSVAALGLMSLGQSLDSGGLSFDSPQSIFPSLFKTVHWWDYLIWTGEFFVTGALVMALINLLIEMEKNPSEKIDFTTYINGFSLCIEGFLGMLFRNICIFLWSILFVIPGVVKYYSWSFALLIFAENPNLGIKKSMRISKILTNGHKSDLFFMDLSFIPWIILSGLTLGILFIWTMPYMKMTKVCAYQRLKEESIRKGELLATDFEDETEQNDFQEPKEIVKYEIDSSKNRFF